MLRISDIRAIGVSIPLAKSFNASYGTRETADFGIIEIEDNQGRIGVGEASTIPIYAEGNQAGCLYIIEKYIKPIILGKEPRDINYINSLISKAVKGEYFLKSALDFAMHDLVGKIYNLPVCQLFGRTGKNIEVCWVIGAQKPEEVSVEAISKLKEGYKVFKLKVGTDAKNDLENLEVLRSSVGESEIRLDANEAWNPKEAIKIIEEFKKYFPKHIEQPVPCWDIEGLRFVRDHSSIPIVADESVQTPNQAMAVAKANSCDSINLKISRCGGFREAYKIIAIAEATGLKYFFGSMLELGIGTIANAHFAAAFMDENIATELIGPQLLEKDILYKPIIYKEGCLVLPKGSGFGIELNNDVLAEYKIKK